MSGLFQSAEEREVQRKEILITLRNQPGALRAAIEELSDGMSAEVLATALLIVSRVSRVSPVRQPLKVRRGEEPGVEVGERLLTSAFPRCLHRPKIPWLLSDIPLMRMSKLSLKGKRSRKMRFIG